MNPNQGAQSGLDFPTVPFSHAGGWHEQPFEVVSKILKEAERNQNTIGLEPQKDLLLVARNGLLSYAKYLFVVALHDNAKMSAARLFAAIAIEYKPSRLSENQSYSANRSA